MNDWIHGRPQSSRSALAEAYENAIKSEAERKALAAVVARRRFRLRTTLLAIAWIGILGGLAVLAMHPEWFNLGQVQETPAERDANLRLTLYIAGRQLEPTATTMGSIRIGWQRLAASRRAWCTSGRRMVATNSSFRETAIG